ncbi:9486_t:CDS:2, partial [Funneliformis geosporum]
MLKTAQRCIAYKKQKSRKAGFKEWEHECKVCEECDHHSHLYCKKIRDQKICVTLIIPRGSEGYTYRSHSLHFLYQVQKRDLFAEYCFEMTSSEWHRYFDENDASTWSIYGFHEEWIHDVKNQATSSKQGKYIIMEKPTVCWSSECLLGGMATKANAKRNQLFADPPNACLDSKRNSGYKNLEQLTRTKLNCEQIDNVTRFSSALTGAAVENLSNVMLESTSVIPKGARTPPPPNKEESKRPKRQSTESNDFDDNVIEDAQEYNPTNFDI